MSANVLLILDAPEGRLPPVALELITLGRQLAAATGGLLMAMLSSDADPAPAKGLIERGVARIYTATQPSLGAWTVEARLPLVIDACTRAEAAVVLVPHGVLGAELAPRLAFRLDGAVATGCVAVETTTDGIACTRPCYGGLVREVDLLSVTPVVASVRAGVYAPAVVEAGRAGEVVALAAGESASRTRVIERTLEPSEGVRLEDARVIVAGGRGLEGPDGFRVLANLAQALGGTVGASRVPCDLGWCPHSWQIGLTGKTVTPDLYIAVGISGAGHHMAGCGNAKAIVAINTDPEAAIFQDARFGVVGDYREVVPALAAELRRLMQTR